MTHQQLWAAYQAVPPDAGEDYEAWAFGGDPDGLAELARTGVKSATSSAEPLYELEGEPLPAPGEFSVILDGRGEAVCVIRTTRVYTVPNTPAGRGRATVRWTTGGGCTRTSSGPSWQRRGWSSPRPCLWCVRSSKWCGPRRRARRLRRARHTHGK